MTNVKHRGFSEAVRQRRGQLNMTQEEVAHGIKTSTPYIGHLESGKRHPSEKIIVKLARVLGLDPRELFFLANPQTKVLISAEPQRRGTSAWEEFVQNRNLREVHRITEQEMQTLSQVAMMGEVRSWRDFLFILNSIRHAFGQ
jgi:transcriptional regulator with XRE-family HTH domain